jgi:hypothetical protein
MGAALVASAVVNVLPSLGRNHASRVALLVMANTAKDNDPEPWYGAGWWPIAQALGLSGTEATQRDRVTKVLGQLEDLRVIRIIEAKAPGRHVRYGLQLGHLRLVHNSDQDHPQPVDNSRRATH